MAGFSYDFGTLRHQNSKLGDFFDKLGNLKLSPLAILGFLLAPSFPAVMHIPTERNSLFHEFKDAAGEVADILMARTMADSQSGDVKPLMDKDDKSVMGLLRKWSHTWCYRKQTSHFWAVKSHQITSPGVHITRDEMMAQVRLSDEFTLWIADDQLNLRFVYSSWQVI